MHMYKGVIPFILLHGVVLAGSTNGSANGSMVALYLIQRVLTKVCHIVKTEKAANWSPFLLSCCP